MRQILGMFLLVLATGVPCWAQTGAQPSRGETLEALRRAVEFFRKEVSTEGGYHFRYAADLSYGRSEHAEGPTQITVQRAGTPLVGVALLEAFDATGERSCLEAARDAAHALVRGQLCSGGWDYVVELDPSKRAPYKYRVDGACGETAGRNPTTLDDNVTQAALRLLMRADRALGFEDSTIHGAVEYALDRLLAAQYPNGAWPQRFFAPPEPGSGEQRRASYPDSWPREWPGSDYRAYFTLNDNSLADMIDALLEAARIYNEPGYLDAAKRGGDFLLLAQMPEPQPAWAQQYDQQMHPAWARLFEPPSVTGGESQSVTRILLTLFRETGEEKYIEPLPRALEYLKRSALPADPDPPARKRRTCPEGQRCLARFYELRTNRPLYITMGTMVRVPGQPVYRPDGYEVSYDDASTISHYSMWVNGEWIDDVAAELERVKATDSAKLRRPDRLYGLSPWQDRERTTESSEELARRVASILARIDARGAWVETGTIGKADRVVGLFAAEEMTVTAGDRTFTLRKGESLDVYRGAKPPLEELIESTTFASNLEALAAYLQRE